MKQLALLTAFLPIFAAAQGPTPEQRLQTAYELLRGSKAIFMRLDGYETLGSASKHHLIDAYWDQNDAATPASTRLKLIGFLNDAESFRFIGDGTTLWSYDPTRNTYRATVYGSFSSVPPADYHARLLQALVSMTRAQATFPARLLRDVFGSPTAVYKSWMPGVEPIGNPSAVEYQTGNPLRRRLIFHLDPTTGDLTSVTYFDRSTVGGVVRDVAWTLSIMKFLAPPADWNFGFVPPAGARPISPSRPSGLGG